jgi:hypothetical protein
MLSHAWRSILTLLPAAGCTWLSGQPTSTLQVEVEVEVADAAQPVTTALGFTVTVEEGWASLAGASLVEEGGTGGEAAGSSTFDPSHPPPGCTLCHGGHCHCDGQLVSYEELAGGGSTTTTGSSVRYEGPVRVPLGTPVAFPTREVPEGAWAAVRLDPPTLEVRGRVTGAGLQDEPFRAVVADLVSDALHVDGDLELSPDREPDLTARVVVVLPAGMWEGVRFNNLETRQGARLLDADFAPNDAARIRTLVQEGTTSRLETRRHDPHRVLPVPEPAVPSPHDLGL